MSSEEANVTFNCRMKGEQLEWTINGVLDDAERNVQLLVLGVVFTKSPRVNGEISATIVFPNILYFNCALE